MCACPQQHCDLFCLVRVLLLPSESKSGVNYFKYIKMMRARDLKSIAHISNKDLYLGYSFQICSMLIWNNWYHVILSKFRSYRKFVTSNNSSPIWPEKYKINLAHHDCLGKPHKKKFLFQNFALLKFVKF